MNENQLLTAIVVVILFVIAGATIIHYNFYKKDEYEHGQDAARYSIQQGNDPSQILSSYEMYYIYDSKQFQKGYIDYCKQKIELRKDGDIHYG